MRGRRSVGECGGGVLVGVPDVAGTVTVSVTVRLGASVTVLVTVRDHEAEVREREELGGGVEQGSGILF